MKNQKKTINEENVKEFVKRLNTRCRTMEEDVKKEFGISIGPLYDFQYRIEPTQIVVYDNFGQLDLFWDGDPARDCIHELAAENGWYPEPVSCCSDFAFGYNEF